MNRKDVDDWYAGKAFPFSKPDSELGYLHVDRDFKEGMDGAICQYRYDELDARRMIAHAGETCRINTYGNSFTSCEQVSDPETWQEALAGHIGEPVRNYGIGGYSVYQAYLRMLREERRAPAKYIVFNVYDDDHYRNLSAWRRIRFGFNRRAVSGTIPYVEVDPQKDLFVEHANPCPTQKSYEAFFDLDSAYAQLKNDSLLKSRVERTLKKAAGESVPRGDFEDENLTQLGIFASRKIVEKIEAFAGANDRKILYVLSYSPQNIRRMMTQGSRFDTEFVRFLDEQRLSYVDTLKAHVADYAQFRIDVTRYLKRYFVGHYNPLGNHFQAFAIKDKLVAMMDPKPPAYSRST